MLKRSYYLLTIFCLACCLHLYAVDRQYIFNLLGRDSLEVKCETSAYTVFAPVEGKGYVIVSNTGTHKIIGYSTESIWDENAFPVPLQEWLRTYKQSDRSESRSVSRAIGRETIPPLLTTHWHQRSPYNDYAPVIADGNIKTVAGCVAIAAAQIVYYWWKDNPDATLKDTPVYPYGGAPVTYSIPKGTANDWELIKNEYTANDTDNSKDAVARLCYVVGTTSYLNYASSTGGQINEAAKAINSQYNLLSDYLQKNKCTQEEWEQLLQNELANGRPVMCSGAGDGGHAFVLDGYDNEQDLYHFNFGWGGSGDGYYPIDDSENAMGGYYRNQSIVYNIHPSKRKLDAGLVVTQLDNGSYNVKVNVNNNGTLPATMTLICVSDDNDSTTVWQSIVNNDNLPFCAETNIGNECISANTTLLLLDDYDTQLCKHAFDITGIDHVLDNNIGKRIYGIDGKTYQGTKLHNGIQIIPNGNGYKKVYKSPLW